LPLHTIFSELRYGVRILSENLSFTAVATLTLALGIGANTAIFAVLDPLLLRKLPIRNPDELVWVSSSGTLGAAEAGSSELGSYYLYRSNSEVFSGVIAFAPIRSYTAIFNGQSTSVNGEVVSTNYFNVLGCTPIDGRLNPSDDPRNPEGNSIVLSFDYWKRKFNADPQVIGKSVFLDKIPYTILGVAPRTFFGIEVGKAPDIYVFLQGSMSGSKQADSVWVTIVARLKPGISLPQAEANLAPLFDQVVKASTLPEIEKREILARLVLMPAGRGLSELRAQFALPARILMLVVVLVLLIACGNVANLLLVRGMARKQEMTIRLALGAGRWQLVRQLLTENALLAMLGGIVGLFAGNWASSVLVASLSTSSDTVVLMAGLDGRVVSFTMLVLVMVVILCGLVPAISTTRASLAQDLKVRPDGMNRLSSKLGIGKTLLVLQVGLSMTLLSCAGLLLRSLANLETSDAGFDRDHVLVVSLNSEIDGISREGANAFYDQIMERARSLPGVRSASYSAFTPISGRQIGVNVIVEGHTLGPGEVANDLFVPVSPGYFETLGIPILAGRDFTTRDIQRPYRVAIINRTMAHHFFGDTNPLGRRFKFAEGNLPPVEIVGVAADSKYGTLREAVPDFFYVPADHGEVLNLRIKGDTKTLVASLRDLVGSAGPAITITTIKTLREQIDESLKQDRLVTVLCAAFSLLALVLTCVGLYGVLSFNVAQRTTEIAVRLALGARPRDIFSLVVGQGLWLTLIGLVLGAAGMAVSVPVLDSLLFGVKRTDPATVVGVILILVVTAILACYLPARRAMQVEPMTALRYE
jgi:predicted permease